MHRQLARVLSQASGGKLSPYQFTCLSQCMSTASSQPPLPSDAEVVICGGGIIGCSVAFHLAQLGLKDVVLLEQGSVTCGTTWHSAGLVGRFRGSASEAYVSDYSSKLYKELEMAGYHTGWKECGSVNVARTKDRLTHYRRSREGIEGHMITADEVKERVPILNTEDLLGGLWLPNDGVVDPTLATQALATKAKELGVKYFEKTSVDRVLSDSSNLNVTGVATDRGDIRCKFFVNCAGMWAHELGLRNGVAIPLHPCEHFYLVTKPMGVDKMMPVVRDYDGFIYLREWSGGILGGGFEPEGKPVFSDGIPPNFEYQLLPEDWDHFQPLLEELLHRVPALEHAEVRQLINGPESFTPDGKQIIGHVAEINNYFVAAGMNSSGVASAGGVGKLLSEWIAYGQPSRDMWYTDVRRFVDLHNNKHFLRERVKETLGNFAKVPFWDSDTVDFFRARKVRTSPIFPRMEREAVFGQYKGYERPLFFHTSGSEYDDFSLPRVKLVRGTAALQYEFFESESSAAGSFGKPLWFDHVRSEYWACREGVCLIDMSTFTKFIIQSPGLEVVDYLQYMCSNEMDQEIGTVIHTGMQNERGGYENDCSLARLADNKYFMIAPTAQQTRSFDWMRDHLPAGSPVQINDVTSAYTSINVIGPRAEELLMELTDTDLSKKSFHSMACKVVSVGQASGVMAMRLTHSGEDGFVLYMPSEYALHVYDRLMARGKNYGIRNAGYYALRALRTEKFFAYWGSDLTPHTTPLECGRSHRVKERGGFIGHEALVKQKKEGIKKWLVQLLLEDHDTDHDTWPWGGESIFRNGEFVGTVTSTAYGYTLERQICLGYVHNFVNGEPRGVTKNYLLNDARYEVLVAGRKFPAKLGIYQPKLTPASSHITKSNRI